MKKLFLIINYIYNRHSKSWGQDFKYEIGAAAGIGFYMGDVNPSKVFRKPERLSEWFFGEI